MTIPQVLNAVERDLRRHFRSDYRLIKSGSGSEALEAVRQLKPRDDPLALFLVDQRMPQMTGTEFLTEAMKFYPLARKVLLTAYADTQAAIGRTYNAIGLDYYLMKPWDSPEENLFPVLDDVLSDWWQAAPSTLRWHPRGWDALVTQESRYQRLPGAQPSPLPVAGHRAGCPSQRAGGCNSQQPASRCNRKTAPAPGLLPRWDGAGRARFQAVGSRRLACRNSGYPAFL